MKSAAGVCGWNENLQKVCADTLVAFSPLILCKSDRQINLFIMCVMQCVLKNLSEPWKSSSVSRGLRNAAESRLPNHRRLSSCYLRCPWIQERSLFFSSHHALPCIPGTQPGVCACVSVKGVHAKHTYRERTERDAHILAHTHINIYTHMNTERLTLTNRRGN